MQNTEEIFETVMHWGNEAKYNHSNFPDIITNKDKIRGFFIGTSYKKEENRNNLDLISFLKPITIYSDLFIQNEVFDKAKDITELFKDYSPKSQVKIEMESFFINVVKMGIYITGCLTEIPDSFVLKIENNSNKQKIEELFNIFNYFSSLTYLNYKMKNSKTPVIALLNHENVKKPYVYENLFDKDNLVLRLWRE